MVCIPQQSQILDGTKESDECEAVGVTIVDDIDPLHVDVRLFAGMEENNCKVILKVYMITCLFFQLSSKTIPSQMYDYDIAETHPRVSSLAWMV